MAMHIECTDEAWVMRMMLMPARERASNRRELKPGTPTMPLPSSEMSAMPSEWAMPTTPPWVRGGFFSTSVPGSSGWKVSFTQMGMPSATTGWMVGG